MQNTLLRTCLVVLTLLSTTTSHQTKAQDLQLHDGATATYLRLKELQTTGSVLHVVAHPDDEDGAMLAYSARGLGARTMLFGITRGEGGANMISSHFFDELGALRTLEHLKAASYYGIDVFYSRAADYGYSKTLDEAMRQWQNGIPILRDLVEVIRREQPTVIVSRFAGDPRDGHGHHQMAGVLARMAFDAAADPNQFPEQLKHEALRPWQTQKLYVRAGSPWRPPKEGEWTIAVPTGTYDPVIGRSYAQIARFGLGFQRSQGITGHESEPGERFSYYRLVKQAGVDQVDEAIEEETFFDGLDVSLSSIANGETPTERATELVLTKIESELSTAFESWNARNPQPTLKTLLKQLAKLDTLPFFSDEPIENESNYPDHLGAAIWKLRGQLVEAIRVAAGLELRAWVTDADDEPINHFVSREPAKLHVRFANRGVQTVRCTDLRLKRADSMQGSSDFALNRTIGPNQVAEATDEKLMAMAPCEVTRPHWSRTDITKSLYDIAPNSQQRPTPKIPFFVSVNVAFGDQTIRISSPVETRVRHPEYGNVRYPLTVVPAISVAFARSSTVLPINPTESKPTQFKLPIRLRGCRKDKHQASVRLELPPGWTSEPTNHAVSFQREDDVASVEFTVNVPDAAASQAYTIKAVAQSGEERFSEGFETVSARDIGRMNIFHDAIHHVQLADVQVLGSPNVAYISGSGDKVAESLAPMGIAPTMLTESDLASGDLTRFDVILVGVRAYAVRDDIRTHNSRLLEYVKQGGTLIVQYQTPEFDQNFGPYPYEMSNRPEEVSEETSTVTILQPAHPIFTTPNKITPADFDGWFEQRGSKFWRSWDEHYTPLLECHDTGQPRQTGGQLIASYGKGHYVYTAYAWYRQLPNGVPGAYRLFANLLSLPQSGSVK